MYTVTVIVFSPLVPGVGLTPTEAPSKDYLGKALSVAKTSTASIGKFTENLPKEKPPKNTGRKRKVNICDIIIVCWTW